MIKMQNIISFVVLVVNIFIFQSTYAQIEGFMDQLNKDQTSNLEETKLTSLTFEPDSKDLDHEGELAYKELVKYVNENVSEIRNLLLMGHAAGSDALKMRKFNPKSRKSTFEVNGRMINTMYDEAQMEDLRLILSWGRAKTIYNRLEKDIIQFDTLEHWNRAWMQAFGTNYADQIDNQNIVQVVIWKKADDPVVNTENKIFVGKNVAGPTAMKTYQCLNQLGWYQKTFFNVMIYGEGAKGKELFDNFKEDIMNNFDKYFAFVKPFK